LKDLYNKASSQNEIYELNAEVLGSVLDKDMLEEALIILIVTRNLLFHAVEWPELHVLLQAANPEIEGYLIISYSEVSKKVKNLWLLQKDLVCKAVQSALSNIHISIDIWTSPNTRLLLAICSHFVNCNEKHTHALLGLREVASHGAEEQWDTLLPVLQDYGITQKLGAVVSDNHSANDKLCRIISHWMSTEEEIDWDPIHHWIRC
jgi:hypothetical protein